MYFLYSNNDAPPRIEPTREKKLEINLFALETKRDAEKRTLMHNILFICLWDRIPCPLDCDRSAGRDVKKHSHNTHDNFFSLINLFFLISCVVCFVVASRLTHNAIDIVAGWAGAPLPPIWDEWVMRAGLCTVSAPLAACSPPPANSALPPTARFLALHLLHQQTLYFIVQAKSRVRELYQQTCLHFAQQGMLDTDLFGLALICGKKT